MRSARSKTVTVWPARLSCAAAASPAGPDPTTATRRPVRVSGGCAVTQPSSNARSMIDTSTALMVTGSLLMPSTHAPSHGRRAEPSRELREVVRRVQPIDRRLPAIAIDEIVPVRDQVARADSRCGRTECRSPCSAPPGRAARLPDTADRLRSSPARARRPRASDASCAGFR